MPTNYNVPARSAGGRVTLWQTACRVMAAAAIGSGLALASAGEATAKLCQESDFAAAVDAAGAELRTYNASVWSQLSDRIVKLKGAKGWPDDSYQELASDHLHDDEMAAFDTRANDLLVRVDLLGRSAEAGPADCARLDELNSASRELLAVMQAKTAYTLAKLDAEIAGPTAGAPGPVAATTKVAPEPPAAPPPAATPEAKRPQPPAQAVSKPLTPASNAKTGPRPADTGPLTDWQARTATTRTEPAPAAAGLPQLALNDSPPSGAIPPDGSPPGGLPPDAFENPQDGYTIEEIRDATRGFFGTISTNLATVIEHAFQSWGRPTAYVLGNEGGGAFLAGVRYGKGTLFLRRGGRETVFWHGPSLGYDFGAEGSRTLFLIYRLDQPEDLFRRFTGVDGSAFLVGGAGVTLLKGGSVIMAPIRTGLGLRIGANIGYIRFTPRATWNPF
ncbi:MAG: EipA family protein [Hyphomicrobiaceae bacterium]|nr:EipA family protein [Hyphomicrobiaceae bacterium]